MRLRSLLFLLLLPLVGCMGVFFQPYRGEFITPDRINLKYEDVYFPSSDGLRLHGWFLPAEGKAIGTILFLHGNAENISTHIGSVFWLPAAHFNVFLPDYRGYGSSQGVPTLPGVIDDSNSALRALLHRADIDPHRIVVLGQSLGGALAAYVGAHSEFRRNIKAVIIDSSFASYRGIAREKLATFWLTWSFQWPLSWTITDAYSPLDAIPLISPIPVLIIHDGADNIIPPHHALDLFKAAREPKELWLLPDGGHIQTFNKTTNRDRLVRYLRGIFDGGESVAKP